MRIFLCHRLDATELITRSYLYVESCGRIGNLIGRI